MAKEKKRERERQERLDAAAAKAAREADGAAKALADEATRLDDKQRAKGDGQHSHASLAKLKEEVSPHTQPHFL